jgi:hypothetical protein
MADISSIIGLTKKEEGGLSKAKTDTASKYPSPYEYNGSYGWHTNRGVTYESFKSLAPKLGYVDNRENFINMPDSIWLKIAKKGYWDVVNLDAMKSQALANLFFSWQWGAGYGWRNRVKRYLATKNIDWSISNLKGLPAIINGLVDKEGEKKILDELIEQYKQFYISLNQPANLKGWLNRAERLKEYAYTLLGKGIEEAKKKPLVTIVITMVSVISIYALYKTLKNK